MIHLAHTMTGETWLMEPSRLRALAAQLRIEPGVIEGARAMGEVAEGGERPLYAVTDGIAEIDIRGVLLRHVPWIYSFFDIEATCVADVRKALDAAVSDANVRAVLLRVHSPGGSVYGIAELGEAVFAARASKPILAHAPDLACSAAYWIASQASRFTAGPTARVGSIGVYTVLEDTSQMAEGLGVRVLVVRSGELKGAGENGAPISDAQVAAEQAVIDAIGAAFVAAVARGRGLTPEAAQALATGRTWLAPEAVTAGLLDAVEPTGSPAMHLDAHTCAPAEVPEQLPAPVDPVPDSPPTAGSVPAEDRMSKDPAGTPGTQTPEQLAAENAALRATLAEQRKTACAAVIERAAAEGRVTPATRESVEAVASAHGYDVAKLEGFVAGLPVATRPGRAPVTTVAPSGAAPRAAEMSAEEEAVAKLLGLDAAAMARGREFSGRSITGQLVRPDGTMGPRR